MLQKKVKKRASLLVVLFSSSVIAIFFILQSLNSNILYFKSPTDIKNNQEDKEIYEEFLEVTDAYEQIMKEFGIDESDEKIRLVLKQNLE